MSKMDFRVAILVSGNRKTGGGGSTADRVARDTLEGKVGFMIGVVICNNPEGTVAVHDNFKALNREFGLKGDNRIDVITINSKTHPEGRHPQGQTLAESAAICRLLEQREVDFVAMLGYNKILTGELITEWGWLPEYGVADPARNGIYHPKARISNNHPGILPFTANTHGSGVHARALELFRKGQLAHTAMTYHLAAMGVDTGPVYYAAPVQIYEGDDIDVLGDRVRAIERDITAPTFERHLILRTEQLRAA